MNYLFTAPVFNKERRMLILMCLYDLKANKTINHSFFSTDFSIISTLTYWARFIMYHCKQLINVDNSLSVHFQLHEGHIWLSQGHRMRFLAENTYVRNRSSISLCPKTSPKHNQKTIQARKEHFFMNFFCHTCCFLYSIHRCYYIAVLGLGSHLKSASSATLWQRLNFKFRIITPTNQ